MTIKWRNPYDEEENEYYDVLTQLDFTGDPGMTLQAPAEEQDINVIMKRFGVTDGGRLPYWQDPKAIYGDFSDMPADPVEAAEMLRQGDIRFQALPAQIRKQFDNGPELYNWLQDPRNQEEAIKLGLMTKTPPTPATLDTVAEQLGKMVSTSTSSDKEQLVPRQSTYTVRESNQREDKKNETP